MSVIWQICAGSILFLWRPLRTPSLCSRQGTLASVLGGFFKHLQLRCEMVHPTAFLFLYFIAKDGRNEGAESYPSNLNSASTWQAISLFWSRSDPPGSIHMAPVITQFCNCRLTESTVIFQILCGISAHVTYKIRNYSNKLIVSQLNMWPIFVNHVFYNSVLWFNFCASLRISDFTSSKRCLLFFEIM